MTAEEKILKKPEYIFYFGRDEALNKETVYIGQAENVHQHLKQHIYDYSIGKEKFLWHTAIVFLGPDLTRASIRYLENRLVEIARECERFIVLTKCTYRHALRKEADIASMEKYIKYVKILLNTLGYKVLELKEGGGGNL